MKMENINYAVIVIQEALEGEELSVPQQINEVFVFSTEAEATTWLNTFEARVLQAGGPAYTYYVTHVSNSLDVWLQDVAHS